MKYHKKSPVALLFALIKHASNNISHVPHLAVALLVPLSNHEAWCLTTAPLTPPPPPGAVVPHQCIATPTHPLHLQDPRGDVAGCAPGQPGLCDGAAPVGPPVRLEPRLLHEDCPSRTDHQREEE